MSSAAANAAKSAASKATSKARLNDKALSKGAKRDPELFVLLGIMSGVFGVAGYYFGRKPTSSTSEAEISVANSSMPWEVDDHDHDDDTKHFKYRYHPRGDKSQGPRNAPSALNTVIIPDVTLPKDVHDAVNKWGKDGY